MPAPSRIIDSHQHVFWHGRDDAGLVADMDAHGIEKAWLLSWEVPPSEDNSSYHAALNPRWVRPDGTHAGIPIDDLLLTRDHYPDRFLVGFCPHPLVGNAPARLKAAHGIHKVRICGEWKFRVLFDDPRCLELYRMAGELGMPVVLHLDVPYLLREGKRNYIPNWYGGTVDHLERALKEGPDTIFVGHAPGFWREMSGDAATDPSAYPRGPLVGRGRLWGLFDEHPNLWADLSAGSALNGLKRDPENAVEFLTTYSDRLLFGRDYYGTDLHDFLQTLNLSEDVVERLYHRNAERVLRP